MVEGNSKLIIEAMQGHWGIPWRVNSIINYIRIVARSFNKLCCGCFSSPWSVTLEFSLLGFLFT
ncbi:unnamed protein product [Malus baccata var. baccata]